MNSLAPALAAEHCTSASATLLTAQEATELLTALPGWAIESNTIRKSYRFPSYARTIGFINLVAWVAEAEDHHPDLTVGYGEVRVSFSTHHAGGLTRKDFICAARLDAVLAAAA